MTRNPDFLQAIVDRAILDEVNLKRLCAKYGSDDFAVLMHLARSGASKRVNLGRLWADGLAISYVDLATTLFQRQIVQLIPEQFAKKHRIIPVYQFGEVVTAATVDPLDRHLVQEAEKVMGRRISPVFAFPDEIEEAIEIEYRSADQLADLSRKIVVDTIRIEDIGELTRDQLQKAAGSQAVVEFVQGLLLLALKERVSDIHIEPADENVRIRFRIDGVLQERTKLEKALLPPVVSRIKILSNLDITERRRPQDGRINLKLPNREIDFRVSCVPSVLGEKIVLRILGQAQAQAAVPDLGELHFSKSTMDSVKRIIAIPHGIFFVTGPTGSGKTTTLFSILKHLNKPEINITTIEDPVEYRLPGITQVQANPVADLDFAAALRSFLRQDPDVLLVGEIRDVETAQIACQAALTGHLVLATLHTNNAVQAITRLLDMGVKPFLVAPSLMGVMAQRLLRKICDQCKVKYTLSADEVSNLFALDDSTKEITLYKGNGCLQCNYTGYAGRIAIHEVVVLDDELRGMIARGDSVSDIQRFAKRMGFQTLRYDGLKKVLRGLTTMEEVNRVTVPDEVSSQDD
ncbi:MAG: GspE/PulE family protein [Acidobacteriota bacterium]